ncbi:hypothetical protein EJB05_06041, partial [Eragrostis curvula]
MAEGMKLSYTSFGLMQGMQRYRLQAQSINMSSWEKGAACMEELTDEDKAIASEVFEDDKNREMFMKHKKSQCATPLEACRYLRNGKLADTSLLEEQRDKSCLCW